MAERSGAKGLFLGALFVAASAMVLAIYQVPQPWRGAVVVWLLFLVPVGMLALRFVRHYYEYKSRQLSSPRSTRRKRTRRRKRSARPDTLKVVRADLPGRGRRTV